MVPFVPLAPQQLWRWESAGGRAVGYSGCLEPCTGAGVRYLEADRQSGTRHCPHLIAHKAHGYLCLSFMLIFVVC